MPEGDSIRRIANQLAPLAGKRLERVTTQGLARAIAGCTVATIDAHGKHLVIDLDNQAQIRVHLGMNGRFRHYDRPTGEAVLGRMSPGRATLALVVDDAVYVWVGARTVEITDRRAPLRGVAIASLGPDILAEDFDPNVAAARALGYPTQTIAAVLLDQRVVAGIGNIYKCESLFAGGVDPRTLAGALDADRIATIYRAARTKMLASVAGASGGGASAGGASAGGVRGGAGRRTLAPTEPVRDRGYAVYSRSGQPCPVCGAPIDCYRLGDPPRWTWSCPSCQPRLPTPVQ